MTGRGKRKEKFREIKHHKIQKREKDRERRRKNRIETKGSLTAGGPDGT